MPPTGGYEPRGDPDSPWEDQPLYMDVGYSRGGRAGGDAFGDVERDHSGGGVNVDIYSDPPVEVSMKQLVFWPVVFLLIGVVWAQTPTQTVGNTPTPTPQTNPTNSPTIQPTQIIAPTPQLGPMTPKNPVAAAPEERGHWVFIPDKGQPNLPPGNSYSIPPAPHH